MFYSLSLLQLPMICEPRKLIKGKNNDIYYPYLLGNRKILYFKIGNIFKGKYDQKVEQKVV
jgi:hypothetical protein